MPSASGGHPSAARVHPREGALLPTGREGRDVSRSCVPSGTDTLYPLSPYMPDTQSLPKASSLRSPPWAAAVEAKIQHCNTHLPSARFPTLPNNLCPTSHLQDAEFFLIRYLVFHSNSSNFHHCLLMVCRQGYYSMQIVCNCLAVKHALIQKLPGPSISF